MPRTVSSSGAKEGFILLLAMRNVDGSTEGGLHVRMQFVVRRGRVSGVDRVVPHQNTRRCETVLHELQAKLEIHHGRPSAASRHGMIRCIRMFERLPPFLSEFLNSPERGRCFPGEIAAGGPCWQLPSSVSRRTGHPAISWSKKWPFWTATTVAPM